jgi:catechol 2,3-dioxygenase-like lactoylglutathione lyase family enzyme
MSLPTDPTMGVGHVGILVADVRAEVDRWSQRLGVAFRPPAPLVFDIVETAAGTEYAVPVPISYAPEGPPWFELLEATGDTVWRAGQGLGVHHVGGHVADLDAEERRLQALGMEVEARIRLGDGTHIITFLQATDGSGTRVELLGQLLYPAWRAWMTGGPPPGYETYPEF